MIKFRSLSGTEFKKRVEAAPLTPPLSKLAWADAVDSADCVIHEGTVMTIGDFRMPAFCTLIEGDLIVSGVLDLEHNCGEGGCFFVTGNLICSAYIGYDDVIAVIGGDMSVRDILLAAFEHSYLGIRGKLKTRFFMGHDVLAEVGNGAEMEYGLGYCLPLDYQIASFQAINPKHSEEISKAKLAAGVFDLDESSIAERIRRRLPVVRWD